MNYTKKTLNDKIARYNNLVTYERIVAVITMALYFIVSVIVNLILLVIDVDKYYVFVIVCATIYAFGVYHVECSECELPEYFKIGIEIRKELYLTFHRCKVFTKYFGIDEYHDNVIVLTNSTTSIANTKFLT